MIDSLKVGRKITESKYLNQENSFRYRNILRIAFYKYEKMKDLSEYIKCFLLINVNF